MIGVYQIKNITNNKVYVGSSIDILKRWKCHRRALENNCHHSNRLQNSFNKNGSDNFILGILEECDQSNLVQKEQYWIDFLNSYKEGYNGRPNAVILNAESIKKIGRSRKGKISNRKGVTLSDKTKLKMSILRKGKRWNPNFKNHSEESKQKIRDKRKLQPTVAVTQFSLTGKLLNQFTSIKEAQHSTKINIGACLSGKQKTAGGYVWKYTNELSP